MSIQVGTQYLAQANALPSGTVLEGEVGEWEGSFSQSKSSFFEQADGLLSTLGHSGGGVTFGCRARISFRSTSWSTTCSPVLLASGHTALRWVPCSGPHATNACVALTRCLSWGHEFLPLHKEQLQDQDTAGLVRPASLCFQNSTCPCVLQNNRRGWKEAQLPPSPVKEASPLVTDAHSLP